MMTHAYKIIYIVLLLLSSCSKNNKEVINFRAREVDHSIYEVKYKNGNWEHPAYKNPFKSFGNHRAVVEVPESSGDLVEVIIPWRRRDDRPERKDIVIVDADTDSLVERKYMIDINNERGHLVFQANKGSSLYYFYFLPHSSTGGYYPEVSYLPPKVCDDVEWMEYVSTELEKSAALIRAKVLRIESIDQFHSFFPMEVIATEEEVETYTKEDSQPYLLFPEYRDFPIKLVDFLPLRWIKKNRHVNGIEDSVDKGEYYSFQVGIYALSQNFGDVEVEFSALKGVDGGSISTDNMTCFNKGGINLNGDSFSKPVVIEKEKLKALWFGIEIPKDTKEGDYLGQVIVKPLGVSPDTVFVKLNVTSKEIADYGDSQPEKMSRLRWLNSKVGVDHNRVIKPYTPVKISGKSIDILGRQIVLNEFGLPQAISSFFTPEVTGIKEKGEAILSDPVAFDVLFSGGKKESFSSELYEIHQDVQTMAHWTTKSQSDHFNLIVNGSIEYDGMLNYGIQLIALNKVDIADIQLLIPMKDESAKYMLGLGRKGGSIPGNLNWKWDITKHQEGLWLGNINKGLQFVLRDNNYERPLNTNFYQSKPLNLPESWYNQGRGGIEIEAINERVNIKNFSGKRTLSQGDTLNFNIRFLITPFKTINTEKHFNTRFVHKYVRVDSVIALNGTVVNVHHANKINPYINYPFYNTGLQKAYIEEAHQKGVKVKLYNTIRELSYKAYELFPLKSLGSEIINYGEGGGHSWLQEHLKSGYHAAWHATEVNDASVLNKGTSRWTNFYIEGISWLAKNQKIDGLYLDDIAFSRSTVKRIANVLSEQRDEFVIDLHSANQFNDRDGYINSAFLYMEHFPYVSRLWFGEYFDYDSDPDYWLTEVSGIPFGLTGEMLQDGGHPYRGMVYGMTSRIFGNYNPGALWKFFDDYEIAKCQMIGYWVKESPVKIDHPFIKNTIYKGNDQVIVAIGSWSDKDEQVTLKIDWDALGFDKESSVLLCPEIKGLQQPKEIDLNQMVLIPKNRGIILVIQNNRR